jgi:hypothetical protein
VDIGRIDITQVRTRRRVQAADDRPPRHRADSYVMVAIGQDPARSTPPTAWFEFRQPRAIAARPGSEDPHHPTDAQPGDYIALVGAQIAARGGGATVGAAAAARTTFTIQPSSDLQALGIWLGRVFTDLMPWSAIVPAVLILAVGLWFVRGRFKLQLRIERR